MNADTVNAYMRFRYYPAPDGSRLVDTLVFCHTSICRMAVDLQVEDGALTVNVHEIIGERRVIYWMRKRAYYRFNSAQTPTA